MAAANATAMVRARVLLDVCMRMRSLLEFDLTVPISRRNLNIA